MHVPIIFLLSVCVLFFIKKLMAIKDGRTRFSGLQYSVAKQEGESLVMFSYVSWGQFCPADLGPLFLGVSS